MRLLSILLFALSICLPGTLTGQSLELPNNGFENGLDHWYAFIAPHCDIELTDDAFEGTSACKVTGRQYFWTGIARDINGLMEQHADYKISMRLKSGSDLPSILKVEIRVVDDRGDRYVQIGRVHVVPDQWSHFEGGFRLQVNGELETLELKVLGELGNTDDFLVDDVAIERHQWIDAANERIENLRKSDLKISLADESGNSVPNHPVSIEQIRNQFAFGTTINYAVVDDVQFQQFLSDHYEWGTVEWHTQWVPVEMTQGVEDYSIVDATYDFCSRNQIQLRGHAIAWSSPVFVPAWLNDLSPAEISDELDERIANVVTRYDGRFASWDVCNEMLNHSFFQDQLGPQIRPHIFNRAREFDSDIPLFTNEFDILTYREQERTDAYKSLIQQLQAGGADVGGIGVQGHFFGNLSPFNIQQAIEELSVLNLPIWVSEFDSSNPDKTELANDLETLYRYAFSRPEIDGILMWGFWAGTHWRGSDAAIVDLDWELNPAGEKYLELRDEWTTELETDLDDQAEVEFRGFHGHYLATVPDLDTNEPTYHLFSLQPSDELQTVELIAAEPGSLSIYGTDENDTFEIYLSDQIASILINGQPVPIPEVEFETIKFCAADGEDQLTIQGFENSPTLYRLRVERMHTSTFEIQYECVEKVTVHSRRSDDSINIYDSRSTDFFLSEPESSTMFTPDVELCASNFETTIGRSTRSLDDVALLIDNPGNDQVTCNVNFLRLRNIDTLQFRFAIGFSMNSLESESDSDTAVIYPPANSENPIELSPMGIDVNIAGRQYYLTQFKTAYINGEDGNTDVVNITDSLDQNEYVLIRPNIELILFRFVHGNSLGNYYARGFRNSNVTFSNSGLDRARVQDTNGDDVFTADGTSAQFFGSDSSVHVINSPNKIFAVGDLGGTNTANVSLPEFLIDFIGDWEFTTPK